MLYYKKFEQQDLFNSKLNFRLALFFLFFSCVLYFSRTMIVTAIILYFSINGYAMITTRSIKILLSLIVSLVLFYTFLFSIKIERNKPGIDTLLYKIKIAPSEILKTKIDRDNHKDLWDHWRGYEAKQAFELMNSNPSSYVFGCGHGSLVNLKFFAPLSGPNTKGMKFISELHNGYPYVLYKTGIIGMLIYLGFLIRLYLYVYKTRTFSAILISSIALFYFFSTLTITGVYNFGDIVIFILGGAIAFSEKNHFNIISKPV
ncbi:O-antigen ligase family protein [Flavobacterium sp.]|uniref:O-antigen ligase family protein n=1 Tax=Flavobacterium sp. TaxID=239 RepID=UPI002613EE7C|nr:O-antigen ligase family protein [Flavobacterium sp.]